MKAHGRFEVYGEMFEKLSPFDTKSSETIYVLENFPEFRRFYLINKRRYKIEFIIQSVQRPVEES